MIPAKADPQIQATYLETVLEPRLAQAQHGERQVFFMDAAHFVHAPYLGMVWSCERCYVLSSAGRQRFNVLGALNATTHELVTVTNTTYINSASVCNLLHQLADRYPTGPITLFLDNARYQRCALVTTCAAELNIELCFLPPYSPNLNLIERLWKFVKKACLYSHYYPNFALFKASILDCLDHLPTTHASALASLLTPRFQIFQKHLFCPA
jgi:transposase